MEEVKDRILQFASFFSLPARSNGINVLLFKMYYFKFGVPLFNGVDGKVLKGKMFACYYQSVFVYVERGKNILSVHELLSFFQISKYVVCRMQPASLFTWKYTSVKRRRKKKERCCSSTLYLSLLKSPEGKGALPLFVWSAFQKHRQYRWLFLPSEIAELKKYLSSWLLQLLVYTLHLCHLKWKLRFWESSQSFGLIELWLCQNFADGIVKTSEYTQDFFRLAA